MKDLDGNNVATVYKWIEHNDRGDEDPSERPQWTVLIKYTVVDARPLHQVAFTHTVKV